MIENEIIKLEEELRLAMIESNVDVLDKLIDESLVFNSPDGIVATKQMDLEAHKNNLQKITELTPSEQTISIQDNLAIVTVKMNLVGSFAGTDISGQYRYLRIWSKVGNDWKVIAGSVTKILG